MISFAAFALATGLSMLTPQSDIEMEGSTRAVSAECCEAEMLAAWELRQAGRVVEAHRLYVGIASRQRDAGDFPGETLWQAAEMSHVLGRTSRAARELDEVARYAKEFGRPNLEVRALLEAGHLYHQARQNRSALRRLERVQTLLASPDVSDETRRIVASRLTDAAEGSVREQ